MSNYSFKYTFQVPVSSVKEIIDKSIIQAKNEDKKVNMTGNFMSIFLERIKEKEPELDNKNFSIEKKNYYFYRPLTKRRANAAFLRIDGKCALCKGENACKYLLEIKDEDEKDNYTVNVSKNNEHNHEQIDNSNPKIRVCGEERKKMANDINLNANGSAKKFSELLAYESESVPTCDALRKMKSDKKASEFDIADELSDFNKIDWYGRLNAVAYSYLSATSALSERQINGFVQDAKNIPQFCMHLYSYEQLECVNKVDRKYRFLHFDATGSLVSIPQKYQKHDNFSFKRILNYFMILSAQINESEQIIDSVQKKEKNPSVNVGELVSSEHDVRALTNFLNNYAFSYKILYEEDIYFRLIILDYSWASIHAVLRAFCLEDVGDYAKRVFKLSKGEIEIDCGKSWLASCVAHTMKRFCRQLKSIKIDSSEIFHSFCYFFSLIVNCVDLEQIKTVFELICIVCLKKTV